MLRRIKTLIGPFIVIALVALLIAGGVVSSQPASADATALQTTPQLRLESANGRTNFGVGETFTIDVYADNVQDFAAWEADFEILNNGSPSKTLLSFNDASRGPFLTSTGRSVFEGQDYNGQTLNPIAPIDNIDPDSTVSYADFSYSEGSNISGPNDSGLVAQMQFTANEKTQNGLLAVQNPLLVKTDATLLGGTPATTSLNSVNAVDLAFTVTTFGDVPQSHGFHDFVEALANAGVTGGIGNGQYGINLPVTREQMAVFLLVAKEGSGYSPPPATGTMFNDVPASNLFAAWIEELARRGITGGCGGGNYCPGDPVTREQMAVFLLVTREGSGYSPPPAMGTMFNDVPASNLFAAWVEELARRGITGGCGGGNYCPGDPVTRGQMAVFLTATFNLPMP